MTGAAGSAIVAVRGTAVAIRADDIDTDRVMPARFLRAITFSGLEGHLFEDDRAATAAAGRVHPLDAPGAREASVLIVNRNFGCGSSREHAPQAIRRWGFACVVGESFADIFFSNAVAIGLPCVTTSHEDIAALIETVEMEPGAVVAIDLNARTVVCAGQTRAIALPESARQAFLTGYWDITSLLMDGLPQP